MVAVVWALQQRLPPPRPLTPFPFGKQPTYVKEHLRQQPLPLLRQLRTAALQASGDCCRRGRGVVTLAVASLSPLCPPPSTFQ